MKNIPILAIDGGGTCSRGAFCDDEGLLLAYTEDGPVNYQNIGVEQTRQTLIRLFRRLLAQMGETSLEIGRAVVGMAGIDTSHDYQVVRDIMLEVFKETAIHVNQLLLENDANMTLLAIADDQPGVLIIAGTGSICCGINSEGQMTRVGGWGHLIGDEGSGYWISQTAIQHIFRAEDGQEAPSGITNAVLSFLKLGSIQELLSWVYAVDINDIASLAPVIFQLAEQGDGKTVGILSHAASDLALACGTAIKKLGLFKQSFTLILGGGILQHQRFVADLLVERLAKHYSFALHILDKQPLFYTLRYGLRKGKRFSREIETNCSRSLHDWQIAYSSKGGDGIEND